MGQALREFADRAREALGPRFDDTLRGIFLDSLEFRTELFWDAGFGAEFERRRGYEPTLFLPTLFRPYAYDAYLTKVYPKAAPSFDMATVGDKVRSDYERTVAELLRENFFGPLRNWATEAGKSARIQAHGGPGDLLSAYGLADVPETEGLYADGAPAFLRLAASAAHLAGRTVVSSEVFAYEQPFAETSALFVRDINRQFVAGINELVFHGYPYRYPLSGTDQTWMPFDSPHTHANFPRFGTKLDEQHPLWAFMPELVQYVRRGQWLLRAGVPVADVAVFRPTFVFPDDGHAAPPAAVALERAGYTYDYVNSAHLAGVARIEGSTLVINGNRYRALVVDEVERLPVADAEAIHALALAGVPVLFTGKVPDASDTLAGVPGVDFTVRALMENLFEGETRAALEARVVAGGGNVMFAGEGSAIALTLEHRLGVAPAVELGSGRGDVQVLHRRSGDADYYFLANLGESRAQFVARFDNPTGRIPERWDLWKGSVSEAPVYTKEGARTALPVELEPGAAMFIGFERRAPAFHVAFTDQPLVLERDEEQAVVGRVDRPGTYSITLSDGSVRTVTVPPSTAKVMPLPLWDIALRWRQGQRADLRKALLGDLNRRRERPTPGIAIYAAYFNLGPEYTAPGVGVTLDLGRVGDAALVKVNGRVVGRFLAAPFRPDITQFVQPGLNAVEIITATHRGSPSGLIGPVKLRPYFTFSVARPTPFAVAVTPANFPNNTEAQMREAIGIASQVTDHVNFQWFWKTPPSAAQPDGGRVVECDTVAPWLATARQLGLDVTLQFQSLYTFIPEAGGRPTVRVASPVEPFSSASYASPALRRAYLEQVACLASLQPEYLVLGPEVNFAVTFNFEEFTRFAATYREAYRLAKRISPGTQVGLSWQYDGLRNSYPLDSWSYVPGAGPQDFIGLTTYFGFSDERNAEYPTAESVPADYYHPIRLRFPLSTPVIFTEVGWSSFYQGGQDSQAAFIERLPELFSEIRPRHAIWGLLHDVEFFEGPGQSLNQSGLISSAGVAKRAWTAVSRMRATGALSNPVPQADLRTLPFGVTVVPPNFPEQRSQAATFAAIAQAAEVGRNVSLQLPWKDDVTGEEWSCEAITPLVQEAHRLGLEVTLQLNTYSARPAAAGQAGALPDVLLLNPIDPPVPGAALQPSMATPAIREAFLERISCLARLAPAYLLVAPEMNFLHALRPAEYRAFIPVYQEAYRRIKAVSPTTQVGVSYQYNIMRDDALAGLPTNWWREIGPQDFVGLTTYFHFSAAAVKDFPGPLDIPDDFYALARPIFGTDQALLFTEVGWSTFFPDGPGNQWLFLARLPQLLAPIAPKHVIWAMQHSVNDYFGKEIEPLNYVGLRNRDGSATASWEQAVRMRAARIFVDPKSP